MTDAREVQRHQRTASVVPSVAIAGYTNAGKSSILNRLTGAGTLVDDALFATLDPTTRRSTTPDGRTFVLTDTVGFVRHLPHELIEAFRSTLEEVSGSDTSTTCSSRSDCADSSKVEAKASIRSWGRCRTKPTVSVNV